MKKFIVFMLVLTLVATSAFAGLIGGSVDLGYMFAAKEAESFRTFEDIENFNYALDNVYADASVNVLFLKAGIITGKSLEGYVYFNPISLAIGPVFADVGLATSISYKNQVLEIGEQSLEGFDWMKMPIVAQAAVGARLGSIELKGTGLAELTPSIETTAQDLGSLKNLAENVRSTYNVGVSAGIHF